MDRTPHLPEQWGGQCLLLSAALGVHQCLKIPLLQYVRPYRHCLLLS